MPVTVSVEMVTLCSCLAREDAFSVSPEACLRLSEAEVEELSWAVNPDEAEPLITGMPPDTVPVMLNWLECCCWLAVDWESSVLSVTPVSL